MGGLMEDVANIINKLRKTYSLKGKIKVLEENKNNSLLKKVFQYTYTTDWVYGIKPGDLVGVGKLVIGSDICLVKYKDIFELLDSLRDGNIDNNVRCSVFNYLNSIGNKDVQILYIGMILKDLNCGLSVDSIKNILGLNL